MIPKLTNLPKLTGVLKNKGNLRRLLVGNCPHGIRN
jgi:hypothetical protein